MKLSAIFFAVGIIAATISAVGWIILSFMQDAEQGLAASGMVGIVSLFCAALAKIEEAS